MLEPRDCQLLSRRKPYGIVINSCWRLPDAFLTPTWRSVLVQHAGNSEHHSLALLMSLRTNSCEPFATHANSLCTTVICIQGGSRIQVFKGSHLLDHWVNAKLALSSLSSVFDFDFIRHPLDFPKEWIVDVAVRILAHLRMHTMIFCDFFRIDASNILWHRLRLHNKKEDKETEQAHQHSEHDNQ